MTSPARPRIAVCGIHIESSTFTPYTSTFSDFEVRRGAEVIDRYPFLPEGSVLREAADFRGLLHARALPGGVVEADAYATWRAEIVAGLCALVDDGPLAGVFLDVHGAMSVQGMDDAEGDLIAAVRSVIGPDTLVSTAMDLHGNISHDFFDGCDLHTCYRTAPHVDVWETRERAVRNLLDALHADRAPHKALVHVPILLPGEMTSTRVEPAASLYARIPELEARDGVTDISLWIGFAWADQPRCQAAVVAFGADAAAVDAAALELADAVWQARHDFVFVAPTGSFDACLDTAIASDLRPYWISDSGDNPGAGGADDTTACLAALAERPEIREDRVSALMVSLVDPETADRAAALGIGGRDRFEVGGKIDSREPGTIELDAEVVAIDEAPDTGRAVLLRVVDAGRPTGLRVVVTERRAQYAAEEMFARLGITMRSFDVVTVKMGYLEPDQYAAAAGWMMALTPGGVDQDLLRLGHHRIRRPLIPFDAEIPRPTEADVVRGQ